MERKTIAVIFGGVSTEHDISLLSAASILEQIRRECYEILCVGITREGDWFLFDGPADAIRDGSWVRSDRLCRCLISPERSVHGLLIEKDGTLQNKRIDAAFPVLHGKNGEDGTIQGLFQLAGIPFVGCDQLASAVCMDKEISKILLDAAGIPNTPYLCITRAEANQREKVLSRIEEKMGYPVFVKPANSGSSVGASSAKDQKSLWDAVCDALRYDNKVLIEQWIDAREVECAVFGNEEPTASILGEIAPSNEFYDYEAKYISGTSKLMIPAPLSQEQSETIRKMAVDAYCALGCAGMSRVDFFVDRGSGRILLNELNTIPGFTSISMYPKLMAASGTPYPVLIDRLIEAALERDRRNTEGC